MRPEQFSRGAPGRVTRTMQGYWAFVPEPLPPRIVLEWDLVQRLSRADRAVATLAGIVHTIPNPQLLMRTFARREAVLSSRIEGTQASLADVLLYEAGAPEDPLSDAREVYNYVRALDHGLARLDDGFPLSLRLLREMHEKLMRGVRGEHLTPGEFRTSQNWIGPAGALLDDATYVPPPPTDLMDTLGRLESFLHEQNDIPELIRVALVHYQFEAIHPFLDGNGRIGRLLIMLLLCASGTLPGPLLYLSGGFEGRRPEYYSLLLGISQTGAWEAWLRFFLEVVADQAEDAARRARALFDLREYYRRRVQSSRNATVMLGLVDLLFSRPAVMAGGVAKELEVTWRTAQLALDRLQDAGIVDEITGRQRDRIYVAREIEAAVASEADSL